MKYSERIITLRLSILDAIKKMDLIDRKLLLVTDELDNFVSLLSAGDIQRAIINNLPLETPVSKILRSNIKIAKPEDGFEDIKKMMFDYRMEFCPVINHENKIVDVYFWEEVFNVSKPHPRELFDLPVIVMAGGFGTRLKPLTNVLPKPLIPIGVKTILENIFDRFSTHGSSRFFISVNYKADLIEFYIDNLNLPFQIEYFIEDKPLGTAGSLSLLKEKINETFFVSNCDILIEQDYSEILKYHRDSNNELTVVAAIKNYSIPYGTIETGKNGQLLSLKEKPDLTFKINSGMYILEPHLLNEIPENEFFHITHLIEKVIGRNGNVGVFPVSEGSWRDIGEWDEYLKDIKVL